MDPDLVIVVALVALVLGVAIGCFLASKATKTAASKAKLEASEKEAEEGEGKARRPLVGLSVAFSGLTRLFGLKSAYDPQNVSEEEIKNMVTGNNELIEDEKRMIHEIIELGDTTVREVMQPRVDMILVEDTETVRQAIDRMRGTGYSRLPVYHEDYDNIIGLVHYKDLIEPLLEDKADDLVEKYVFAPMFVPENKAIYSLLSEMQTNRQQMAIVVDEYGGTDGLITLEDIIEEIVGEISDESDAESELVVSNGEGEWIVAGRLPTDEAADLGWPVEESDDYETIAGWLLDRIDTVPQLGDEFMIEGYSFKIRSMRRRRILSILVKRLDAAPEDSEALSSEELDSEELHSATPGSEGSYSGAPRAETLLSGTTQGGASQTEEADTGEND